MPFHDLNIPYTSNHVDLFHTLSFAGELGYSTIAVSLYITGKLPVTPQPIPVSSLTVPSSVTALLTRLTLTISDTTQNHRLSTFQPAYSLLALRPTTERALQLCCTSLECDLISLDLSQRLPFVLKFKTVASALQRGIRFEICYSPGIQSGNGDARRNLISGATALIRATRGRGIILSSEAEHALGVRGPYDVINLAQVWGLGQERGKEALCEEASKVLRLAGLKRTSFRGVVEVVEGGDERLNSKTQGAQGQKEMQSTAQQRTDRERFGQATGEEASTPSTSGTKRKASGASVNISTTNPAAEDDSKPVSKREMKRRAKKARIEAMNGGSKAGPDDAVISDVQDTTAASDILLSSMAHFRGNKSVQ